MKFIHLSHKTELKAEFERRATLELDRIKSNYLFKKQAAALQKQAATKSGLALTTTWKLMRLAVELATIDDKIKSTDTPSFVDNTSKYDKKLVQLNNEFYAHVSRSIDKFKQDVLNIKEQHQGNNGAMGAAINKCISKYLSERTKIAVSLVTKYRYVLLQYFYAMAERYSYHQYKYMMAKNPIHKGLDWQSLATAAYLKFLGQSIVQNEHVANYDNALPGYEYGKEANSTMQYYLGGDRIVRKMLEYDPDGAMYVPTTKNNDAPKKEKSPLLKQEEEDDAAEAFDDPIDHKDEATEFSDDELKNSFNEEPKETPDEDSEAKSKPEDMTNWWDRQDQKAQDAATKVLQGIDNQFEPSRRREHPLTITQVLCGALHQCVFNTYKKEIESRTNLPEDRAFGIVPSGDEDGDPRDYADPYAEEVMNEVENFPEIMGAYQKTLKWLNMDPRRRRELSTRPMYGDEADDTEEMSKERYRDDNIIKTTLEVAREELARDPNKRITEQSFQRPGVTPQEAHQQYMDYVKDWIRFRVERLNYFTYNIPPSPEYYEFYDRTPEQDTELRRSFLINRQKSTRGKNTTRTPIEIEELEQHVSDNAERIPAIRENILWLSQKNLINLDNLFKAEKIKSLSGVSDKAFYVSGLLLDAYLRAFNRYMTSTKYKVKTKGNFMGFDLANIEDNFRRFAGTSIQESDRLTPKEKEEVIASVTNKKSLNDILYKAQLWMRMAFMKSELDSYNASHGTNLTFQRLQQDPHSDEIVSELAHKASSDLFESDDFWPGMSWTSTREMPDDKDGNPVFVDPNKITQVPGKFLPSGEDKEREMSEEALNAGAMMTGRSTFDQLDPGVRSWLFNQNPASQQFHEKSNKYPHSTYVRPNPTNRIRGGEGEVAEVLHGNPVAYTTKLIRAAEKAHDRGDYALRNALYSRIAKLI